MHRIAFKIGLTTAIAAGLLGFAVLAMGKVSPGYVIVTALAVGAIAYGAARQQLRSRMRRLGSSIDALRREGGRTNDMQSVTGSGDELESLLRRTDQASQAVRRRIADLNRAENFRREYVGDVSHELKTPIFAIQGFAETLLAGAIDDRRVSRNFVEKILQNAARLDAMTKDLAEISRLESGALELSPSVFDVKQMYEEVRESLALAAELREIEVWIEADPDAARVVGDRDLIRQGITNLVDNALKYNEPGGWVRLFSERDAPGIVRLGVQDNGIGIAAEHIGRVTERFYRADKSRSRSQGGTGLGLSIVKHILAAHRRIIEVESEVGQGTTVSFTLPSPNTTE